MLPAGKSLRTLREKLGLTMRDVENSSAHIAEKYRNEEFSIPPSRLSDVETKGILPSIYRVYTLSVIYRRDVRELLAWYGVDLNNMAADLGLVSPPKSHVSEALSGLSSVQVPLRMDPGFDDRRTTNLGRMVEQWGLVPFAYLSQFANSDFTYGYIGTQDFTMYPILPPGSFIQSMRRATRSSKARGVPSTSAPSTSWKLATDTPAVGAACGAKTLSCSRIHCHRFQCASCAIPRRPKSWDRSWESL